MRLLFDVETTGLYRFKELPTSPSQPHIIQIGMVLFSAKWEPVAKFVSLIKPDGWTVEPEAEAIHGISEAKCSQYGIPILTALLALQSFTINAMQIVGHNVEFDSKVAASEIARLGGDGMWWQKKQPTMACTMRLSTDQCQLAPSNGRNGYKWPKLEEAHEHFYPGSKWVSSHDAEGDLMATARVARALDGLGLLPAPFTAAQPFRRME